MTKTFRSWDVDQSWLLPASVHEFVPEGHLAHFVRDTVREGLDISTILTCYREERGFPPYHPGMMVALLLYCYSRARKAVRFGVRRPSIPMSECTPLGAMTSVQALMSAYVASSLPSV